jgi:N-acetylglutamate synthase-like GNAT family acetyltransferase
MPPPTAKVEIRKARLADARAIAELSGQLGYPATEKEMAQRLSKLLRMRLNLILIAETAAHQTIGWLHVSVTPLLEVPLRAEVNGLVVDENQRSRSAGAALLKAAERWARVQGCQSMSLRSNVIRERAHEFYSRHGYEHYKTQKSFRKTL